MENDLLTVLKGAFPGLEWKTKGHGYRAELPGGWLEAESKLRMDAVEAGFIAGFIAFYAAAGKQKRQVLARSWRRSDRAEVLAAMRADLEAIGKAALAAVEVTNGR